MNGHKSLKLKALLLSQDGGETWLLLRQYYLTDLNSGQFLDILMQGTKFQKMTEEHNATNTRPELSILK